MKKIIVSMNVDSKNMPYIYEGEGLLNKDLILFSNGEYKYIFDLKIKRLIKEKENDKMIIDFKNKQIKISNEDLEIDFNIEMIASKENKSSYSYKYKLDKEEISFNISYKEV